MKVWYRLLRNYLALTNAFCLFQLYFELGKLRRVSFIFALKGGEGEFVGFRKSRLYFLQGRPIQKQPQISNHYIQQKYLLLCCEIFHDDCYCPFNRFSQIFIIFRRVVLEICDSSFFIQEDRRSLYGSNVVLFQIHPSKEILQILYYIQENIPTTENMVSKLYLEIQSVVRLSFRFQNIHEFT